MAATAPTLAHDPLIEGSRVLRPGKWRALLAFLLSATLFTIGLSHGLEDQWIGWTLAALFGPCALFFGARLPPGSAYLELTCEGFTICSGFRCERYAWSQVSGFGVVLMRRKRLVGFHRLPSSGHVKRRVTRPVSDLELALPESFGLIPDDLASLLNEWRTLHLSRHE